MDDYARYEADCKKVRNLNKKLLTEFRNWLQASGLAEKTIKSHVSNIDVYINEFLPYEEPVTKAEEGASSVNMYLGYWFIKKAMWASKASIKSNAASLTKFYTFLLEKSLIERDELDELKLTIKEEMPEWLATLERYDDPSVEDVWEL